MYDKIHMYDKYIYIYVFCMLYKWYIYIYKYAHIETCTLDIQANKTKIACLDSPLEKQTKTTCFAQGIQQLRGWWETTIHTLETNISRPWKSMVGRWHFLLEWPIFKGYVSFREGNLFTTCIQSCGSLLSCPNPLTSSENCWIPAQPTTSCWISGSVAFLTPFLPSLQPAYCWQQHMFGDFKLHIHIPTMKSTSHPHSVQVWQSYSI